MPNFFYQVHFYLFGLIAIASSIAFVTRKSPVAAVLWLVNTMFCLAALYLMLEAHFIGVIQVLVYAGAESGESSRRVSSESRYSRKSWHSPANDYPSR